jgi:hypothetical protein
MEFFNGMLLLFLQQISLKRVMFKLSLELSFSNQESQDYMYYWDL